MLSRHRTGGRFKCDPDVKRFGRSNALWAGHGGSGSGDGIMSLASLDLDFTNNQGRGPGGATKPVASFLTTTRASTAYAPNAAGVYSSFASNVPRITDKGLRVEEARTNSIRNNSMQGAVVGVIGSGGALPTYWATAGGAVSTIEVVGVGTQNGIDYIDIRFAGTPSSTGPQTLYPDLVTGIAAQVWTNSLWVSLVAGSLTNIGSGGLFALRAGDEAGGTMFAPDSSFTRQTNTRTLASTEAGTKLRWAYGDTVTAVDFTLRIGWPQCELGSFATSPIRTTSAAATRAADAIVTSSFGWYTAGPGTMFVDYSVTSDSATSIFPGAFSLDDGTGNNRINLHSRTIDDTRRAEMVTAGVSQGSMSDFAAFTYGVSYKTALAFATNDAAFSVAGSAVATDATVSLPTVTTGRLGALSAGPTAPLNGYLRRVAYFPTRLTNAQLQALTA